MKKLIVLFLLNVSCNAWMAAQRVTGLLGAFPPEVALLQQKMVNKKEKERFGLFFSFKNETIIQSIFSYSFG